MPVHFLPALLWTPRRPTYKQQIMHSNNGVRTTEIYLKQLTQETLRTTATERTDPNKSLEGTDINALRRVERRTAYTPAGVLEGTDIKCNLADRATDQIDPKIDPKNAQKLAGAIATSQCGIGSPTRARTWDLRINSPSLLYVIFLHHQLLTASAHLRHRSRMQCNAAVCKTTLLRFCIQLRTGRTAGNALIEQL